MAISFHPSDIHTCFGSDCDNAPEFKIVEWQGAGVLGDGKSEEAGPAVMLMCRDCMLEQVALFRDELKGVLRSDIPTQAILVLPIRLTDEQVSSLREEITPHVWLDSEDSSRIC